MRQKPIFATNIRKQILDECEIPYTVDAFLNFVFPNAEAEARARKRFKWLNRK